MSEQAPPAQRAARDRRLGRTQKLVLNLLAITSPQSIRDLARNWPTLTESSARSAVDRLGNRGMVDMAGWDAYGRCGRTFKLTARGEKAAARLLDEEVRDAD